MTFKKFIPSAAHLFTYSVILILVLPSLVQHGMFMDGTQYACVARDMAEGKGTFWFPHLSDSWIKNGSTDFMEHLPLAYFLQSKFFLVFGESVYTEKVYCFVCLLLSAFFIARIWKLLPFTHEAVRKNTWLPLLFWFTCGSVFWAYQNNMLEITVTVFVVAAIYFFLEGVSGSKLGILHVLASGTCIFLASLSKGLPGLFPVTAPLLWYFCCRNISFGRTLLYSLFLVLVPASIYLALWFFNTAAHDSLQFYVNHRLLFRISNEPQVDNHLTVLWWLLTDIICPLLLVGLLFLIFKTRRVATHLTAGTRKTTLFFLLLGLAGVVPLTFTLVQRAVYFVPALPFLAIALSLLVADGIEEMKKNSSFQKHKQKLQAASMLMLTIVLITCASFAGQTSRDEEMLDDVRKICATVPPGSYIDTTPYLYDQWDFQFYLLRYHKIVLWREPNACSKYRLVENAEMQKSNDPHRIDIGLKGYALYKKTGNP